MGYVKEEITVGNLAVKIIRTSMFYDVFVLYLSAIRFTFSIQLSVEMYLENGKVQIVETGLNVPVDSLYDPH